MFLFFGPPFFYRGPPYTHPAAAPPYPLHRVFIFIFYFLPPFFYRGPPLYHPCRCPLLPLAHCTEFDIFFFVFFFVYPHFFIGSPPYSPPATAPPTPCTEYFFFTPLFCPGWWCEGGEGRGGGEKVHLLTHGSTSGDHG